MDIITIKKRRIMKPQDLSLLEAIQQHIESTTYEDFSPAMRLMYDEIIKLNSWKSTTGRLMAESKKDLNKRKSELFNSVLSDPELVAKITAPSVIKEYIACRCYDLQYNFDFAERVNSSLGYSIESLRSILSAVKQELSTTQFQQ